MNIVFFMFMTALGNTACNDILTLYAQITAPLKIIALYLIEFSKLSIFTRITFRFILQWGIMAFTTYLASYSLVLCIRVTRAQIIKAQFISFYFLYAIFHRELFKCIPLVNFVRTLSGSTGTLYINSIARFTIS